jgi:hypothetical protein
MTGTRFQSDEETSTSAGKAPEGLVDAAKPYIAAMLIVTILLSIWAVCVA